MRIRSLTPVHPVIRDAVRCVFVIEQDSQDDFAAFLILPSVSTYASFSSDTRSYHDQKSGRVVVEQAAGAGVDAGVQFGLSRATICEYRGHVREVCIVFNPGAIFDFFDESVRTAPGNDFRDFGSDLLAAGDDRQLLEIIETGLAERHRPFDHSFVRDFLPAIGFDDAESTSTLSDLAKRLGVSRQTLNAQCRRFLGMPPSEFRKIDRFRRFVDARLAAGDEMRLTDCAYEFGFFDQSHLNKDFRNLTLLRPGDFFRRVDCPPDSQVVVVWQ